MRRSNKRKVAKPNPVAKARATGEHGPKRSKMVHVGKKNKKPKYKPDFLEYPDGKIIFFKTH